MEKATATKTSVHVGCFGNDYGNVLCKDAEMTADYDVFGRNVSMNANRLSWFFDFRGTSMNVDTACSSSLVALDLACRELLAGNTDMVRSSFCSYRQEVNFINMDISSN
jgi:acyl transferase domain-containing protein